MERIELALAANGGAYSDALILTAASIARFASRDVALRFNILDGGLDFDRLVSTVGRMHPHVEFNRLVIDEGRFSAFKEFHGSRMTYACFALFMKCRGAGRFRERIAFGRFRRLMRTLG